MIIMQIVFFFFLFLRYWYSFWMSGGIYEVAKYDYYCNKSNDKIEDDHTRVWCILQTKSKPSFFSYRNVIYITTPCRGMENIPKRLGKSFVAQWKIVISISNHSGIWWDIIKSHPTSRMSLTAVVLLRFRFHSNDRWTKTSLPSVSKFDTIHPSDYAFLICIKIPFFILFLKPWLRVKKKHFIRNLKHFIAEYFPIKKIEEKRFLLLISLVEKKSTIAHTMFYHEVKRLIILLMEWSRIYECKTLIGIFVYGSVWSLKCVLQIITNAEQEKIKKVFELFKIFLNTWK